MSARRKTANTRARRRLMDTRARRLRVALALWECSACGGRIPIVYKTRGDYRYVTCEACGEKGKLWCQ